MSLTQRDHALVAVYGMRDSRRYDDVAEASRKAVELGATVVSRLEAPQLEAVFSDIFRASSFAIWLSRREIIYHTYQLTQVTDPTAPPWPQRDAERVKASCVRLVRAYNTLAQDYRVPTIPQAHAELVAQAIERTPLLTVTQE